MNFTNEDIQKYTRIVLNWLAGALVTWGAISPNATWVQPVIGVLITIANFGWTLYGGRIQAKVNEVAKLTTVAPNGTVVPLVESMHLNDSGVAFAAPANVTAAPTAVK